MKHITFLSILIFLNALASNGQDIDSALVIKAAEAKTPLFYTKKYYKNGNLKKEGWVKRTFYTHSIIVKNKVLVSESLAIGIWKYYYRNGMLEMKYVFPFIETDTIYYEIFDKKGKIISEGKAIQTPLPTVKSYGAKATDDDFSYVSFKDYSDGVLILTGSLFYGKRDGEWKWYGKNGNVRKSKVYKNGDAKNTL